MLCQAGSKIYANYFDSSDGDVEYYNMFFKEATYALVTQIIIGGKPVGGSNYALIDYGAPIFFVGVPFPECRSITYLIVG